jgi:hypothetical protein
MTTGLPALRAWVIYGLCLPLALLLGFLLGSPLDFQTIAVFGILALVISAPLLFKWHHALAIVSLKMTVVAFFAPGGPQLWMLLTGLSLSLSVIQLALLNRRMRFLSAPSVTLPILFLLAVVLLTAKFTAGIGFHILGGSNIGGRRYITVFAAIIAYFALIARRIPLRQASFYSGLFFLGGATAFVSSLVHFVPANFTFIFYLFPPEALPGESSAVDASGNMTRLGGVEYGAVAMIYFLLARYGLRGSFLSGKPWRACVLLLFFVLTLFGGFRSQLILIMLVVAMQAWLEGLLTSRLMPVIVLGGVLMCVIALPFTTKLPLTLQRTLAFLPVEVDPAAKEAAQVTTEWRIRIWKEVLPQVPQYLLLGKGFAINVEEWSQANASSGLQTEGVALVAGDYHSGPLSTIIPFGLWGALGFIWLLWAGGRLLYFNFRYGDPALQTVNSFLLSAFVAQTVLYLVVFGSFHGDLVKFTALFGLSIALNGGKCRPAPAPARQPVNIKFRGVPKPAAALSR